MRTLLLLILVLGSTLAICQKEGNIWYFGNLSGLDFNKNPPQVLKNSRMASPYTGSSSISDNNGNLLFYTNGISVWNKNHQIMENGTDLFGHKSCDQSALIVKQPLNDSLYYIFTTDYNEGFIWPDTFNRGVNYSIVNIKLNNGLGKVISKNINILKATTQKIAAIRHKNGKDVWIIIPQFFTNNIYSYLLTDEGINFTPEISITENKEKMGSGGCLKGSPNGNYIARIGVGFYIEEIFKFDNSTGKIFNYLTISRPLDCSRSSSVEFSPDESKLYLSYWMADNKSPSYILQYNLNVGSPDEIIKSQILVGTYPRCFTSCALLTGPDLKIYVANYNYIGIINSPNENGLKCNYIDSAFYLDTRWCNQLPNLINDYYIKTITDLYNFNSDSNNEISIYPNPAFNGSQLVLKGSYDQIEKVKIMNIHGCEICSYNNVNSTELILNNMLLNSGSYYAIIYTSSGKISVKKFVIVD